MVGGSRAGLGSGQASNPGPQGLGHSLVAETVRSAVTTLIVINDLQPFLLFIITCLRCRGPGKSISLAKPKSLLMYTLLA